MSTDFHSSENLNMNCMLYFYEDSQEFSGWNNSTSTAMLEPEFDIDFR